MSWFKILWNTRPIVLIAVTRQNKLFARSGSVWVKNFFQFDQIDFVFVQSKIELGPQRSVVYKLFPFLANSIFWIKVSFRKIREHRKEGSCLNLTYRACFRRSWRVNRANTDIIKWSGRFKMFKLAIYFRFNLLSY